MQAKHTVELKQLPPVLSLHLKRTAWNPDTNSTRKVRSNVKLPLTLDVKPFMAVDDDGDSNSTYELAAVLIHKVSPMPFLQVECNVCFVVALCVGWVSRLWPLHRPC